MTHLLNNKIYNIPTNMRNTTLRKIELATSFLTKSMLKTMRGYESPISFILSLCTVWGVLLGLGVFFPVLCCLCAGLSFCMDIA